MNRVGSALASTITTTARMQMAARAQPQTVYLTHVKWVTGKKQLENYFSRFGTVKNINLFFDPVTGLHKGYASLTFDSTESAAAAMKQRPHVIDGDRVNVELFVPLKSKVNTFVMDATSKSPRAL